MILSQSTAMSGFKSGLSLRNSDWEIDFQGITLCKILLFCESWDTLFLLKYDTVIVNDELKKPQDQPQSVQWDDRNNPDVKSCTSI